MRHTRNALRIAASVLAVAGMAGPAFPVFGAPPPTTSAAPPPLKQVISVPVPASRLPPPVNPTNKPKSTAPSPAPLVFAKQKGCIQSSVGAVQLKNMPWPQQTLQIAKAHQFATGAGQTVAVIDTGVHRHSQFQNRLVGGGDYVLPGGNGLEDCDGHGTEVAGIIGAKTAPDTGFDGMAPGADIVSIRQTSANYMTENKGPNGQGQRAGTLGTLAKAVMWAANFAKAPNGKPVSVINISLAACHTVSEGLDPSYRALQAAIHYAVHRRNIVVVAAAGNLGKSEKTGCTNTNTSPDPTKVTSIPIPAWFGSDVLTVGAVAQNGDPSSFSVGGPWVGVAAPGEDLISLDPAGDGLVSQTTEPVDGNAGGSGGNQPSPLDGTSFAAPYVSGLVALVRQKYPRLTAQQVIKRIEFTAQHPAGPSGRNNQVGFGMIDPVSALTDVVPSESGVAPAKAQQLPANLPPPYHKNWTPMVVALSGTGSAVALLLLVMFVTHTMRRSREQRS